MPKVSYSGQVYRRRFPPTSPMRKFTSMIRMGFSLSISRLQPLLLRVTPLRVVTLLVTLVEGNRRLRPGQRQIGRYLLMVWLSSLFLRSLLLYCSFQLFGGKPGFCCQFLMPLSNLLDLMFFGVWSSITPLLNIILITEKRGK